MIQASTKKPYYQIVHRLPARIRVRVDAIYKDAALARGFEQLIRIENGVESVQANSDSASITIAFSDQYFNPVDWLDRLNPNDVKRVDDCSPNFQPHSVLLAVRHATLKFEEFVPPLAQFLLGTVALVVSLVEAPAVITAASVAVAVAPILNRAVQTLTFEKRLGADFLDGLSCVMLIRGGSFFPTAVMTTLIATGELIRDLISDRCQDMIVHQLELSQRSAWLVKGNRRIRTPISDLQSGARLVVYPGELVPCHGTIIKGKGTLVPASPEMGFTAMCVRETNTVEPDCILMEGKLYIEAGTILRAPRADLFKERRKLRWLQRTRLHRMALRTAYKTVWPMMSLAALFFVITKDVHRALAIICFDFITGIKIALPTAVLSSMYKAGDSGIVIRNASAFESLSEVDAILFAHSGVLTEPTPLIIDVFATNEFSVEQVTSYAASIEQQYDHLVAYAIYSYVQSHATVIPERTNSSLISGLGLKGDVDGHHVVVGRTRLLEMQGTDLSQASDFLQECYRRGDSRVCVSIDGKLAGVIAYQDPLRSDVPTAIAKLREMGIEEIGMMTGGSQVSAETLAKKAGIPNAHYRTLPEDQASVVRDYKRRGLKVAVVGYDLDDALALEQADVAITLGSGADVARHRADVVLTSEDLNSLPEGIQIARDGMKLARESLVVATVPNVLGLAYSVITYTDSLWATILNNGAVIVGAANSLRPLLSDDEGEDEDEDEQDQGQEHESELTYNRGAQN